MRVTLTKQQALVAKCTDKDYLKVAGHVVRISKGRILSSDGFGMARAPIDYDGEPVFVEASVVSTLKHGGDIEVEGETVRTITKDGTTEYKGVSHVDYPDVDSTWQKLTKRKPKACIAMNAALLRKMLSCIECRDGGWDPTGRVKLYVRGPTDPLEWRIDGDGEPLIEGLIMPMFVNWEKKGE